MAGRSSVHVRCPSTNSSVSNNTYFDRFWKCFFPSLSAVPKRLLLSIMTSWSCLAFVFRSVCSSSSARYLHYRMMSNRERNSWAFVQYARYAIRSVLNRLLFLMIASLRKKRSVSELWLTFAFRMRFTHIRGNNFLEYASLLKCCWKIASAHTAYCFHHIVQNSNLLLIIPQ